MHASSAQCLISDVEFCMVRCICTYANVDLQSWWPDSIENGMLFVFTFNFYTAPPPPTICHLNHSNCASCFSVYSMKFVVDAETSACSFSALSFAFSQMFIQISWFQVFHVSEWKIQTEHSFLIVHRTEEKELCDTNIIRSRNKRNQRKRAPVNSRMFLSVVHEQQAWNKQTNKMEMHNQTKSVSEVNGQTEWIERNDFGSQLSFVGIKRNIMSFCLKWNYDGVWSLSSQHIENEVSQLEKVFIQKRKRNWTKLLTQWKNIGRKKIENIMCAN